MAERVQHRFPSVNISTVYRTLDTLTDLGVVDHVHFGHGRAVYHLRDEAHQHLYCERCERVEELPANKLRPFVHLLEREYGFELDRRHFAIVGTCGPCQYGAAQQASFVAVPGSPPSPANATPRVISSTESKGVYATQAAFDKAGFWRTEVSVNLDGKQRQATTDFKVLEHHAIPFVGDAALPTDNLTASTPNTPPAAVDSRASAGGLIPDPELHQTTIAAALAAHRPVLAVFATPVYCISRFCGPTTDAIQQLARTYGDRATFVHVEIWHDFQKQQINKAAADWLYRNNDLNEPWVFFIGADGKIAARWDNVADQAEIESMLKALPVIGKA